MSMFEDSQYRWRETYFVLFQSSNRPVLETVKKALAELSDQYTLTNLKADDSGLCESLTLLSPDDFAALDVCYTGGVEVLEQGAELADEMRLTACDAGPADVLQRIKQSDGRFDVLHFERVPEFPEEEDADEEMLDPTALILVLGALAKITGGIAVDPQAGTVLSEE
ncbi:MAG: hypothetical protein JXB62_17895 [Pirellulales bacterium]|nr:hypothetical protein [Pirellulales bacterium]